MLKRSIRKKWGSDYFSKLYFYIYIEFREDKTRELKIIHLFEEYIRFGILGKNDVVIFDFLLYKYLKDGWIYFVLFIRLYLLRILVLDRCWVDIIIYIVADK